MIGYLPKICNFYKFQLNVREKSIKIPDKTFCITKYSISEIARFENELEKIPYDERNPLGHRSETTITNVHYTR